MKGIMGNVGSLKNQDTVASCIVLICLRQLMMPFSLLKVSFYIYLGLFWMHSCYKLMFQNGLRWQNPLGLVCFQTICQSLARIHSDTKPQTQVEPLKVSQIYNTVRRWECGKTDWGLAAGFRSRSLYIFTTEERRQWRESSGSAHSPLTVLTPRCQTSPLGRLWLLHTNVWLPFLTQATEHPYECMLK